MNSAAKHILKVVTSIEPWDNLEAKHIADVSTWINSGSQIFRIAKPDNPPKHLVSYFVPYDSSRDTLMLIDHTKANAWLSPGGHIEQDEDPISTVIREADEELGVEAKFDTVFGRDPLFVTVNTTKPPDSHVDVSIWYVVGVDSSQALTVDEREMRSYRWFTPSQILQMDIRQLDINMHRFIKKMQSRL